MSELALAFHLLALHLLCSFAGYTLYRHNQTKYNRRRWLQGDRVSAIAIALILGPLVAVPQVLLYFRNTWRDEVKW